MSVPITICDDSSFARSQVQRALPADWDVSIHFAADGTQALQALADGLAELLFLDLTMPIMDGVDVLEEIQALGIPAKVIVISGDIQPAIRERVQNLGALTFLEKPIDGTRLVRVLKQHGLYHGNAAASNSTDHLIERNDWLKELINVAMGDAANRLAQALGIEITLSVPHVSELTPNDIKMLLAGAQPRASEMLITQGFIGHGISGECLLFVEEQDDDALLVLLPAWQGSLKAQDTIFSLANILNGSLLERLFNQFGHNFHISPPVSLHHYERMLPLLGSPDQEEQKQVAIEICYAVGSKSVRCNQIVVFTPDACDRFDTLLRSF